MLRAHFGSLSIRVVYSVRLFMLLCRRLTAIEPILDLIITAVILAAKNLQKNDKCLCESYSGIR